MNNKDIVDAFNTGRFSPILGIDERGLSDYPESEDVAKALETQSPMSRIQLISRLIHLNGLTKAAELVEMVLESVKGKCLEGDIFAPLITLDRVMWMGFGREGCLEIHPLSYWESHLHYTIDERIAIHSPNYASYTFSRITPGDPCVTGYQPRFIPVLPKETPSLDDLTIRIHYHKDILPPTSITVEVGYIKRPNPFLMPRPTTSPFDIEPIMRPQKPIETAFGFKRNTDGVAAEAPDAKRARFS